MDVNEITKNMYISDQKCAANYSFLKQLGIQHIVVAGEELSPHFPLHFNYLHLRIRDSPKEKISDHFETVSAFIGEALQRKESVLVHCAFGVSRSATLVIAFLMRRLKIGYE
jgi:protein-tyrosine phosphatase